MQEAWGWRDKDPYQYCRTPSAIFYISKLCTLSYKLILPPFHIQSIYTKKTSPPVPFSFLCSLFFHFCSMLLLRYLINDNISEQRDFFNPSDAEVTFVQSTKKLKNSENHLNPVVLVFIGKLSRSTVRWVPICHGFSHFSAFCHHFMLTKLASSSKRVKW